MILNDLFENKLSDFVIAYQDYLRLGKSEERARQFEQNWGLSPRDWVRRHWRDIAKLEQLPLPPDHHVMREDDEDLEENLRKWFKEKWVRFNPQGKIMGPCARGSSKEGKPKCLPQSKAHALGKKGRASAAAKKRREDPNPERRGPAKNVATKVREAAGLYGPFTLTINTGERPTSRTKTKKFKREDDAILWAEDWFEDFPQYVYATAEISDPEGNVVWYSDETMADGERVAEDQLDEKQDACYHKVKSRYKVWPSAYASGALVQCRKKGAANWGTSGKKKK